MDRLKRSCAAVGSAGFEGGSRGYRSFVAQFWGACRRRNGMVYGNLEVGLPSRCLVGIRQGPSNPVLGDHNLNSAEAHSC